MITRVNSSVDCVIEWRGWTVSFSRSACKSATSWVRVRRKSQNHGEKMWPSSKLNGHWKHRAFLNNNKKAADVNIRSCDWKSVHCKETGLRRPASRCSSFWFCYQRSSRGDGLHWVALLCNPLDVKNAFFGRIESFLAFNLFQNWSKFGIEILIRTLHIVNIPTSLFLLWASLRAVLSLKYSSS